MNSENKSRGSPHAGPLSHLRRLRSLRERASFCGEKDRPEQQWRDRTCRQRPR